MSGLKLMTSCGTKKQHRRSSGRPSGPSNLLTPTREYRGWGVFYDLEGRTDLKSVSLWASFSPLLFLSRRSRQASQGEEGGGGLGGGEEVGVLWAMGLGGC